MGSRSTASPTSPYGETYTNQGSVDFHQRRYTSQEQDPETGLYFYNARYYNPALGRFVSPDSLVSSPGDPQSLNRYSYTDNNPVNRIDPSGHGWFSKLFKKIIGAIVGIIVGVVASIILGPYGGGFVGWWAAGVIGGAIGGAAAGAVNTAVNGGNWAKNVGFGALLGALGGAIGPPLYGAYNIAGAIVAGAIVGGVGAALYGGNVLQGIAMGAVTAAAFAVVVTVAVEVYNSSQSPALAEAGSGSNGGGNEGDVAVQAFSRPIKGTPVEHKGIFFVDDGRKDRNGPRGRSNGGANPPL